MWGGGSVAPPSLTSVEEHVPDDGGALVDLEGVSAQNDPLQHHALGVAAQQGARGDQVLYTYRERERWASQAQTHTLTHSTAMVMWKGVNT